MQGVAKGWPWGSGSHTSAVMVLPHWKGTAIEKAVYVGAKGTIP